LSFAAGCQGGRKGKQGKEKKRGGGAYDGILFFFPFKEKRKKRIKRGGANLTFYLNTRGVRRKGGKEGALGEKGKGEVMMRSLIPLLSLIVKLGKKEKVRKRRGNRELVYAGLPPSPGQTKGGRGREKETEKEGKREEKTNNVVGVKYINHIPRRRNHRKGKRGKGKAAMWLPFSGCQTAQEERKKKKKYGGEITDARPLLPLLFSYARGKGRRREQKSCTGAWSSLSTPIGRKRKKTQGEGEASSLQLAVMLTHRREGQWQGRSWNRQPTDKAVVTNQQQGKKGWSTLRKG